MLLRAAGDLEVYERALAAARPAHARGGRRLLGAQQIGDLLAYLRALANPLDERALYSALASPLVGCSRDALALLARRGARRGGGAWETAQRARGGAAGGLAARPTATRSRRFCARLAGERATARAAHDLAS